MIEVAEAIAWGCDADPQRRRHSSAARRMGSKRSRRTSATTGNASGWLASWTGSSNGWTRNAGSSTWSVGSTRSRPSAGYRPARTGRVRDLFSHMVGLGVDVLAGDEPNDHNATWTQRQVDERRGHDLPTLVEEWRGVTEPMQAYMRERGTRPLGDLVIHEQDLRGALGVSGAQDTPGLAIMRDRMLRAFAHKVAGLPPIALVGDDWRWASTDGDPAVVVRAPDFELARALMARRSAAQLRSWTRDRRRGALPARLRDPGDAAGPRPHGVGLSRRPAGRRSGPPWPRARR